MQIALSLISSNYKNKFYKSNTDQMLLHKCLPLIYNITVLPKTENNTHSKHRHLFIWSIDAQKK